MNAIMIGLLSLLLAGCASSGVSRQVAMSGNTGIVPGWEIHSYMLTVVDQQSQPIEGARVTWELSAKGLDQDASYVEDTNEVGMSSVIIRVPAADPIGTTARLYRSNAKYVVVADGYVPDRGEMWARSAGPSCGQTATDSIPAREIRLKRVGE